MPGTVATDRADWNSRLAALPHGHLLQTWEWGEFKGRHGWSARRVIWDGGRAAAQILTRRLRGLQVMYVPKGPLLDWSDPSLRARVLDDLEALARRERAIFIKIDPDLPLATGLPGADQPDPIGRAVTMELGLRGWRLSADQVQFRNTACLDLRPSEAEILAGMKQKTRYNIRLAQKKGVRVRLGSLADLDLLYRLYAETSVRDGFVIRPASYYHDAWGSFIQAGLTQPFVAEVGAEPVGALVLYTFARTAWYMYGMSREAHREKMPNHLLQWEAMRWAKARGCETYDFWGAPNAFDESDSLWGVWKFKRGFGGQVVQHIGAWDYAPAPAMYWLYSLILPRVLSILRGRGRRRTRAALE